jgi:hypothetical protein
LKATRLCVHAEHARLAAAGVPVAREPVAEPWGLIEMRRWANSLLRVPRYPDIEPYQSGLLDAGDGNLVYWETCGNPDGVPALIVHGGPGSGCAAGHRRSLDPEKFRIILFDQRTAAAACRTLATPQPT